MSTFEEIFGNPRMWGLDTEPTLIDLVPCKFCGKHVRADTAHLHDGGYVGDECCWDERLRATE